MISNRTGMVLLGALLASTRVPAQTADGEASRRTLLREAQEASDAGNPAQALSLAERAGQVRMHPSVRYFIAEQQKRLGQIPNSMNSAKLCVLEATQTKELKKRDEIIRRCNDFLNEPLKLVARIVISFTQTIAPETEVRVGEQVVPELLYGRPFFVAPGQARVQASAPGCISFDRELVLLPGEEVAVSVSLPEQLRRSEVALPAITDPNPVVTPLEIPKTSPPTDLTVTGTLPKDRSTHPVGAFVLLGAGGASLGASVVFLILRNNQIHKLEAQCSEQQSSICLDVPAVHSMQTKASTYNLLTNVALGVGAAAAASGAFWLILEKTRGSDRPSGATLQISPTSSGAQVAIQGAF